MSGVGCGLLLCDSLDFFINLFRDKMNKCPYQYIAHIKLVGIQYTCYEIDTHKHTNA